VYNDERVAWERDMLHPTKEAKPYQVEQARDFLTAIGVKP